MAVVDPSEARMEFSHRSSRTMLSALAALLLLAQLAPAAGQGRKEPSDPPDQPSAPKQGCAILPAAKVEAVFGHFDDALQNGGYQNEAKVRTGRIAEHTSATCLF